MSEFLTLMDRGVSLMQIIGGSAAGIFLCHVGWLFLSSGGDPQAVARARGSLFGIFVGLMILSFGTVAPRVFSEVVLEPSGGARVGYLDSRQDCDGILQRQLVLQRAVNSEERVNYLIAVIQAKNEFCVKDNWDPVAVDSSRANVDSQCTSAPAANVPPTMGRLQVPPGLRVSNGANRTALDYEVKRDGANNIVVHFSASNRPTNYAACWVYFSRYDAWRLGRTG